MAGENFGMATRHMMRFQQYLKAEEILLNAGEGIQVETSERLGRGKGDGLLGITNERLLFVFHDDRLASPFSIDRSWIRSAARGWVVIPGSSQIKIATDRTHGSATLTFYVGTRYSRDIVLLLN
jgi:hypothetical protein